MTVFFSQLINGLSLGSIYALIALGYSMVYGIILLLNFAHGDVIMVGAYMSWFVMNQLGLGPVTAVCATILTCTLLGVVIEKIAYTPLRSAPRISLLITAIGVSFFLEYTAELVMGSGAKVIPSYYDNKTFYLGKVPLGLTSIITLVVTVLSMLVLTFLVQKTKLGKAMRAVSEDMDAARLMGINVNSTISFTFAVGSALAGSIHILRNGAHGLAELSLLHQKGEHQHGQHGDHQRDDRSKTQRHLAQTEGLVGVVGGDHLCTRAEDQLCRVLQKEGDTNGGDQQRNTGCAAQGGVGDLFDHHAQQRTGDDGGAHSGDRAKTQLVHDEPRHVCAHHDDIAVGKVQQQDNAVHHAVAQCDQCIDAAKGQAVDQLAKEHCHGWILPFFAAFTLFDIKNGERLTRKKLFRRSPKKSWGLLCAGGSITGGWNSADQNISFSSGLPST